MHEGDEIIVDGPQTVSTLSELLQIDRTRIVGGAFRELGLLLTIYDSLQWAQVEGIAEVFGLTVRPGGEYSDPEESD